MAFLHCHSCDWGQDDFWDKSYNPITKMWTDIKWLWKPRWFQMDDHCVDDLSRYTGVKVFRKHSCPHGQLKVHSWNWLLLEMFKELKVCRRMKWWTWKGWKKEWEKRTPYWPVCPECGNQDFDID